MLEYENTLLVFLFRSLLVAAVFSSSISAVEENFQNFFSPLEIDCIKTSLQWLGSCGVTIAILLCLFFYNVPICQ